MGCTTCSNNKTENSVPNGCKSNGNCASGGCERMSVFNWLADLPFPSGMKIFDVVEVAFKNGRKDFYRNEKRLNLCKGDTVTIEGAPGFDVGIVMLTGELVKHQMKRKKVSTPTRELKKIYRKSSESDIASWKDARSREWETMHQAREMAIKLGLEMKISDVEYQGDGKKAIFYYTANQRVDFRELIKMMAGQFKIRIEMKQIGSRQEAGRLGGIGACGRELCCSTWLTDFRSVSTSAARYQQLSLNPQKLAGQCGKLKCCLNYELDQYADALKMFPDVRRPLKTKEGDAIHIKTDVFRRMMWFLVQKEKGGNSIIPLEIEKVREVIEMNKNGIYPKDLNSFAVVEEAEVEPAYENVVGQDDLTRFDKNFNKKKKRKNNKRNNTKNRRPNQEKKEGDKQKQASTTKKPNNRNNKNRRNNRSKNNNNKRNQSSQNNKPKE